MITLITNLNSTISNDYSIVIWALAFLLGLFIIISLKFRQKLDEIKRDNINLRLMLLGKRITEFA